MPKRSEYTITKSRVDALQHGQQIWDSKVVGFGIVANKNSKTYKLKYAFHGVQRMLTIGRHGSPYTVDLARNEAIKHLSLLKSGVDPAVSRRVSGLTMEALCREYLERHADVFKKPGSAHQDKININNHVIPLLGTMLVSDVAFVHIEKFRTDVLNGKMAPSNPKAVQKAQKGGTPVRGGPGVANRCLALLSKMFNLAETWTYRPQNTNPVVGVSKFRELRKERFLSDEERLRVWQYMDEMEDAGTSVGPGDQGIQMAKYGVTAIRLLILTGARCGEILSLKWSMVDLKNSQLNLEDSKTGRRTIQISSDAVEVLEGMVRVKDNEHVIVGFKDGQHLKNIRKVWLKIRKGAKVEDVRIHDLRHSFASFAAHQNIPLSTIGSLMGHKSPATTHRYIHVNNQQTKDAANKITGGMIEGFQRSKKN